MKPPGKKKMARHSYDLTDETRHVLSTGKVKDFAEEWGVNEKHAYAILANTYTDPFAVFETIYAAAIRAGNDVRPWENKLKAIREKYEPLSRTRLKEAA